MRRRRIHEKWDSYRREVLPSTAPQVQIVECRRAFYAGAAALLSLQLHDLEGGEEGWAMMDGIQRELAEFGKRGGV